MPFNPARHGPGAALPHRKSRLVDPHSGRRHSDIVNKNGQSVVHSSDLANRKVTASGWRIDYFNGDFDVYYELMCARNASGLLRHETKDRCIRVLSGQLFVTVAGQITSVLTNQVCVLTKGTEYELATSGDSDVELLVTQDSKYDEDVDRVSEASVGNSTPRIRPTAQPIQSRSSSGKAQQAAEALQDARTQRIQARQRPVPRRPDLAGQQVIGVNPRPVGAGGFGGDE